MISIAQLRVTLAAEIDSRTVSELDVYPRGVDGQFRPPAVVLGQVDVEYDVQPCNVHTYTIGVATVVAVDGLDMTATQQSLEDSWLDVEQALRAMLTEGGLDVLGPVNAAMTRAESGSLIVQGKSWPAQAITLEITG